MELIPISGLKGCTAILGGSFDPIHMGHLHIANQVLDNCEIDELLLVPCAKHPFKTDSIRLSYAERCRLIECAIFNQPRLALSLADESGSGFTSHLMQKLTREHPSKNFAFIIGSDNLANLHKWHDFPWLCANVHFIILPRPEYSLNEANSLPIKASILPIPLSPISSSDIRHRIALGESIRNLVPTCIESELTHLYCNQQG